MDNAEAQALLGTRHRLKTNKTNNYIYKDEQHALKQNTG